MSETHNQIGVQCLESLSEAIVINRHSQQELNGNPPNRQPLAFHKRLPGYAPTKLLEATRLAAQLGVGSILVKDESRRFDLPAFKILGASWAVYRSLMKYAGRSFEPWSTIEELREKVSVLKPLTLVAATDGNHGRAVAYMSRLLGFDAHIFVPCDMVPARIEAIKEEGALVTVVNGTYDDAVARSAKEAGQSTLVISDTSWPGYEDVPCWVTDGYSTIFWEIDDQIQARKIEYPDIVFVQMGVGALAKAVVQYFRSLDLPTMPKIIGVEPVKAACVLASVVTGEVVSIPGPHDSLMAGLNCGKPSLVAWPVISRGLDICVAIGDDFAMQAMQLLATESLIAGETGAAGLAGLLKLLANADDEVRQMLNLGPGSRILVVNSEGATDPDNYRKIVSCMR